MKTKLLSVVAIALLAITSISCSNNDDEPAPIVAPTPVVGNGFTWRENDPNSTIVQTAASASFSNQYKTLIAKNATGNTIFEINLSGTTPATYIFGNNSGNAFIFTTPNPAFDATSGEFIITANTNDKMSGTFKAFIAGTGITRIYGTVYNIPVI